MGSTNTKMCIQLAKLPSFNIIASSRSEGAALRLQVESDQDIALAISRCHAHQGIMDGCYCHQDEFQKEYF